MSWKDFFKPNIISIVLFLILFVGSSFISSGAKSISTCSKIGLYGFPSTWVKVGYITNQGRLCESQIAKFIFQPKIIPLLTNIVIYLTISLIIVAVYKKFKK